VGTSALPVEPYERLLARSYDALYSVLRDPSGDAAFYRDLAVESGGPILELGCGTGRVLLPIAALGLECVGVDASPEMLEVLREKHLPANLQLVEGRMETFDLGPRRFRLVTAPFRAFQHLLDVESQLAALANILRHLAPGGAFAFDVFDPKLARIASTEEAEHLAATFTHDGRQVRRWDTVVRNLTTQVMRVTFRFEGEAPELAGSSHVQLRWFYRYEIEHLLARAGFSRISIYGGYDRRPWQAEGDTVVVAHAP
jgi:ubiquinone/menaquinone biosynthesis C-methylase UbiE